MIIKLEGEKLTSESDFHEAVADALNLSEFYGMNLSALADVLSTDVERPLKLIWKNADASRRLMGARFDDLVRVLQRVELEDAENGYEDRFQLILE